MPSWEAPTNAATGGKGGRKGGVMGRMLESGGAGRGAGPGPCPGWRRQRKLRMRKGECTHVGWCFMECDWRGGGLGWAMPRLEAPRKDGEGEGESVGGLLVGFVGRAAGLAHNHLPLPATQACLPAHLRRPWSCAPCSLAATCHPSLTNLLTLPCPALPCPALPCPALPCPLECSFAEAIVLRALLTCRCMQPSLLTSRCLPPGLA